MEKVLRVFTIDPQEPRRALQFTIFLASLSAGILLLDRAVLASFSWPILLFALLTFLADIMPIELPRGDQRVSIAFAIVYATILLFPPNLAAIAIASGTVIGNMSQGKKLNIWLFNGAQVFISAYVAARLWNYWAPGFGIELSLIQHFFALLGTAILYFMLNLILTTISVSLAHNLRISDILFDNIKWSAPNFFTLWILGLLIAILYQSPAGVAGVMLLWLPLLVVRLSFKQYIELKEAHMETIRSLATALDAKDPYTHGHSKRVAELAKRIAREFYYRESEIEAVYYAGLLHDIGKIAIHDGILNKTGLLTEEELAKIRLHPDVGANIVKNVRFLDGIADMIRHHHEFYNGEGYPDGLAGDDIPLGARILCVADAYDAMTIDRVYRSKRTQEDAVNQLLQFRGIQFDPAVVDVFVERVLPEMQKSDKTFIQSIEVEAL